jgi:polar amino acid transport system substrate-binding protein
LLITSCGKKAEVVIINGPNDLKGKIVGVQQGTTSDIYVSDLGEGTKVERFVKNFEVIQALKQGKIDAIVMDSEPSKVFVSQNDDLTILAAPFSEENYAAVFSKKNRALRDSFNKALAQVKANGTVDKIADLYINKSEAAKRYQSPANIKYSGKLTVALNAEFPPYEYVDGKEIVGFDIDLARAICDKLGRELEIVDMNFDSVISAVEAGKADFGMSGITMTEERKKTVDFSDSYHKATLFIIIRK